MSLTMWYQEETILSRVKSQTKEVMRSYIPGTTKEDCITHGNRRISSEDMEVKGSLSHQLSVIKVQKKVLLIMTKTHATLSKLLKIVIEVKLWWAYKTCIDLERNGISL